MTQWLDRLRETGAEEEVRKLADRAVRHVDLSGPVAVAFLLDRLQETGAEEQVRTLAHRLPAGGRFEDFQEYAGSQFRFGREQDGSPAEFWGWDDLD